MGTFALFQVGVAVGLAALTFVAVKYRWAGFRLLGAALIVAGGASNLIDRMVRGSVVDFMSIGSGMLRTGIFNVADLAIVLGGVFIVLAGEPVRQQS